MQRCRPMAALYLMNALRGLDGVNGIELISGEDLKVLKEQQEAGVQTPQENTKEPPTTEEVAGNGTEENETVTTETE